MAQLMMLPAMMASGGMSAAMLAGSTLLGTMGAIQSGKAAEAAKNYEAQMLDRKAKEEMAVATRQAGELKRQNELEQSRARAVGAAFGGGVDADIIGDLEEVGELNALTALWEGQTAADSSRASANLARAEGSQLKRAGYLKAAGTILEGGSTMYDRYAPKDIT